MARRRLWTLLLVLAVAASACGDERAAPVHPSVGPRRDGGLPDAASPPDPEDDAGGPVRPTGGPAVLPPADVEIVLPYLGEPVVVPLRARVELERLDVHFSIDTTGSFDEEISELRGSLQTDVIPRLRRRVDDVAIGLSRFEDFPVRPFGANGDRPFQLLAPVSTSASRVSAALRRLLPLGGGADAAEAGVESLYQIATGEGFVLEGEPLVPPFDAVELEAEGGVGGVGFRAGALHLVVQASDARAHDGPEYGVNGVAGAHGTAETLAALRAVGARVLGIASNTEARAFLVLMASQTGATARPQSGTCRTGLDGARRDPDASGRCALVYDIAPDGTGLADAIVDGIVGLLDELSFVEVYGDSPDDRLRFVQRIEAVGATGSPAPRRADRRPVDGFDDTFLDVSGDVEVELAAVLRNETLRPADYDQAFRLTLQVVGDGLVLAETIVRVVVPRGRLAEGGDGGAAEGGPPGDGGVPDADRLADGSASEGGPALDLGLAGDAAPPLEAGLDASAGGGEP